MRARYSAFALGRADFLLATGTDSDAEALRASLQDTQWLRLEVHRAEGGGPSDGQGTVAFSAWFLEAGTHAVLRETSRFERVDGRWRYIDGSTEVEALELGRNDPCPCGSGKKTKRCHSR